MFVRSSLRVGIGILAIAGTTFAGLGCASSEPKSIRDDTMTFEEYPQITPLEKLHRKVKLSQVVEKLGPPLNVTVIVRHDDSDDIRHIQFRYFFEDKNSLPENTNPDWHYVQLEPKTLAYLQGNALNNSACKWRLEIRPGR